MNALVRDDRLVYRNVPQYVAHLVARSLDQDLAIPDGASAGGVAQAGSNEWTSQ